MKPELEKYYNTYFDLFRSEGWKQLIEELTQNAVVINSVEATKDPNDLFFRKGQLNVLAYVINFEAAVNNAFESVEQEDDA